MHAFFFQLEGYRVLVLYCSCADPTVCLPEPHSVVIPSSGQDHWVTPDCALVYIHGCCSDTPVLHCRKLKHKQ